MHRIAQASAIVPEVPSEHQDNVPTKITLALKLNGLIDARDLSQTAAAGLLRMPQAKVAAIRNYKLRGISLECLLQALAALGQHIDIVVSSSTPLVRPALPVAA